eukprot:GHVT01088869.1.p2 GENE.GHVT01088869.1~~GHVT01088869.1.p2  ORF type:complete len:246 (+),score=78.08 GHVT01088869.1:310-1047(+)
MAPMSFNDSLGSVPDLAADWTFAGGVGDESNVGAAVGLEDVASGEEFVGGSFEGARSDGGAAAVSEDNGVESVEGSSEADVEQRGVIASGDARPATDDASSSGSITALGLSAEAPAAEAAETAAPVVGAEAAAPSQSAPSGATEGSGARAEEEQGDGQAAGATEGGVDSSDPPAASEPEMEAAPPPDVPPPTSSSDPSASKGGGEENQQWTGDASAAPGASAPTYLATVACAALLFLSLHPPLAA